LIGNAKQYVTVSLGAGMVLSSLVFNISADTLLSIEETEELYYDLKEDEYEQFGKV
jgi:molybdopterin-binding protein